MIELHKPQLPIESSKLEVDVLIVGAGPTGLGAATRLNELNKSSWLLTESDSKVGGLASTCTTAEGFLFDLGGHVIFSHYEYFDNLLDRAVGTGPEYWNTLNRESFVWIRERFVPYPFQNNLYALPRADQVSCVNGLIDAPQRELVTFDDWIASRMGEGIANIFMRPYNYKVWAFPTTELCWTWLGERVAPVDLKKVMHGIIMGPSSEDTHWGPNSVFKFPVNGGTGSIWNRVSELLPADKFLFNSHLVGIDLDSQVASYSNGQCIKYKSLINTTPLDLTLDMIGEDKMHAFCGIGSLKYSSTHVIGLGIRGVCPAHLSKSWIYYPESNCPFYRCTVFSSYATSNCPDSKVVLATIRLAEGPLLGESSLSEGPYWSLMFEVSESAEFKPVNCDTVIEETIQGAIATRLISPQSEIVSIFYKRLERGYPTPHVTRDVVLEKSLSFLRQYNVWNRGRFGSWKYEFGNQDHSLMLGVEAVDEINNN